MVVRYNGLQKAHRGQARILEAVIAAVIIFIVFSVAIFLIRASETRVLQERADLDRLGYNVLHTLAESGTLEATIETDEGVSNLMTVVQRSLPSQTYFKLTIFNCEENPYDKTLVELDPTITISNTPADSFANSLEVSSTSMIYTSRIYNITSTTYNIYNVELVLTRGG